MTTTRRQDAAKAPAAVTGREERGRRLPVPHRTPKKRCAGFYGASCSLDIAAPLTKCRGMVPAGFGKFADDVEIAAAPASKVWRLVVWRVAPEHAGLMARLKLIPARKNPSTFWRSYPKTNRSQVEAAVALLKGAGLHGNASLQDPPRARIGQPKPARKPKPFHNTASNREGFGGALNATPIVGSWRRKTRHA